MFVYGGTILPGAGQHRHRLGVRSRGRQHATGKINDAQLLEVERTRFPGPGSCGGMYTANTMASAIEALGMSLPNSSAQDAVSDNKRDDCRRAGAAVVALLKAGITPRDILTRKAFENAITVTIALAGSTNAVLHLLAIAHEAGVQAHARRLHAHRQARAGAGRPAAQRQLHDGGAGRHRRHPAADEDACSTRGCCTATA